MVWFKGFSTQPSITQRATATWGGEMIDRAKRPSPPPTPTHTVSRDASTACTRSLLISQCGRTEARAARSGHTRTCMHACTHLQLPRRRRLLLEGRGRQEGRGHRQERDQQERQHLHFRVCTVVVGRGGSVGAVVAGIRTNELQWLCLDTSADHRMPLPCLPPVEQTTETATAARASK